MLIDFRERGREEGKRKGEKTSVWQRDVDLCHPYAPQPGTKSATQASALTRDRNFQLTGHCSSQLSRRGQRLSYVFKDPLSNAATL